MDNPKEIVFKTKITPKLGAVALLPLGASFVLAYFAVDAGSKFGPNDPTRFVFVGIPALISAVIILTMLLVCHHFLNRVITIRGDDMTYEVGSGRSTTLNIAEMAFSSPAENSNLRTLMFSDGVEFIQIPQLFLGEKEFAQLTSIIMKRRKIQESSGQKTYSL